LAIVHHSVDQYNVAGKYLVIDRDHDSREAIRGKVNRSDSNDVCGGSLGEWNSLPIAFKPHINRGGVARFVELSHMLSSHQKAEDAARKYLGVSGLKVPLGFGAEGLVLPTMRHTAIKVFTHEEKFLNELAAYGRLEERNVENVLGFWIPGFVGASPELMVIEMTIVRPPFLVDFSQAKFDEEEDFPEGLDEWWGRLGELFGSRLSKVQAVFYELRRLTGISYYDLAPRNMNFGDEVGSGGSV
jgi:hypothetical protein